MDLMMVIGEPGVGKSTLVEELTRGAAFEDTESPFPFRRYDCGVTEFGIRREDFPGTDAYPMDIQPRIIAYMSAVRPKLVLVEGDRLANAKFLDWARDVLGYEVWLYNLFGPDVAEQRRAARGHEFDPAWLKGRQTKVDKLAYLQRAEALDAEMSPREIAAQIGNPVAEALRSARS